MANIISLKGIVVGEDDGIQPDVEPLGDPAKIGGLVVPIDGEAGDVGTAKKHVGMRIERGERMALLVLGRYGEDDAAAREIARIALKIEVGLAERAALTQDDPLDAHLADHASPQGIVEIEDQAFERAALSG